MTSDWFRGTPGAAPDALRLFCLPHAGGNAALFTPWRRLLLPDIDVCPVLLPGRDCRRAQPPYTSAPALVDDLTAELLTHQERPFAFFGHSLGAALAYAVAGALERAGGRGPQALIVSGRRSPYAPRRAPRSHLLDDDAFVAALAALGGVPREFVGRRDTYKFFVPLLRADFAVDESYVPGVAAPGVRCPVLAVTGADDPLATPDDLDGWREVTRGGFFRGVFPGGHQYLRAVPGDLLAAIRTLVSTAAQDPDGHPDVPPDEHGPARVTAP